MLTANCKIYILQISIRFVNLKDTVVIACRTQANTARTIPYPVASPLQVSLSLVLALSERSSWRIKLESLFLDEGFGTLDNETLDAALNAMVSLRLSGRTIGVIGHINQLTRSIPVRIDVKRTGLGTPMSIKMLFSEQTTTDRTRLMYNILV